MTIFIMLKVHFVFAPLKKRGYFGEVSEGRVPPLSLLYLASFARKQLKDNLKMKFTDGLLCGMEKSLKEVEEFQPDILALSFYTPQAEGAYEFINRVKKRCPEILVIAGGVHITALPEELFRRSKADIAVIGEGEETFSELLNLYSNSKENNLRNVEGIAFRDKGGKIIWTAHRAYIKDLNTIPFPAYDLINLRDYKGWYLNRSTPEAPLFSARGCPYWCTFCSNIVWKINKPYLRLRSPENVVDEIEWLTEKYGIKEIYECSDEFNNSVKNALGICEEIKRRGLKVWWKTSVRADNLPENLIKGMAEAGCWYVLIGIESGNRRTINGIEKRVSLEEVEESCRLLKKIQD